MSIILLLILITYQAVAAITDMRDIKKFKGMKITEKIRLNFYKEAIIWGWIPVLILFVAIAFLPMSFWDIGLRKIALSDYRWMNIVVVIISVIVTVSLMYQVFMYFTSEQYRKEAATEFENKKSSSNHYDSVVVNLLLPHTLKEKKYFLFVSLTAGICEEIFLRGGVMFLLADIFPDLHIVVIGLTASVLFGLFHCYQGLFGIIKTGVAGIFFVMLYIATGSLIPGMILHFFMDFSSAFIVKEE